MSRTHAKKKKQRKDPAIEKLEAFREKTKNMNSRQKQLFIMKNPTVSLEINRVAISLIEKGKLTGKEAAKISGLSSTALYQRIREKKGKNWLTPKSARLKEKRRTEVIEESKQKACYLFSPRIKQMLYQGKNTNEIARWMSKQLSNAGMKGLPISEVRDLVTLNRTMIVDQALKEKYEKKYTKKLKKEEITPKEVISLLRERGVSISSKQSANISIARNIITELRLLYSPKMKKVIEPKRK